MKDNLAALGKLFWQFEIAGVPLPRLTVQGKVGRREGEWWLKVWGERLLFCAADAPGRVFAVVTPCENEPNLAEFWRAAVKCGDYGRLIVQEARLAQPLETKSAFATIYSQNGAQWTREWCGGPWFEGRTARPSAAPIWHRDWREPRVPVLLPKWIEEVWSRPFPSDERCGQNVVWLRGSRSEWKRVCQACATAYLTDDSIDFHGRVQELKSFQAHPIFFAHTPFSAGKMAGFQHSTPFNEPWHSLLSSHFVVLGWTWARRKNKYENLRKGWKVAPSMITIQTQLTLHPSQHQQLEARLYLRDWLRGKVPAAQIAKLLE